MAYEGEKYLLKTHRDLYKRKQVKKSGNSSDSKYEYLHKYLERLKNIIDNEREDLLYHLYNKTCEKYIIKEKNIPKLKSDNTPYTKKDKEGIILNQKKTLSNWFFYLTKNDLDYPFWLRYWIFKSVVTLGSFNNKSNRFNHRSKRTTSSFPELNEKAVNSLCALVTNYVNNKEVPNDELGDLIKSGSFNKLYSKCLKNSLFLSKEEDGIWKTYKSGEGIRLTNDLKGKDTGWCIKNIYEAAEFLEVGNIKIYYTKDSDGSYSVPRLALREVYEDLVEVRGIEESQNVEDSMLDVLEEELNKYNSDYFKQILYSMKYLYYIYKKHLMKKKLTKEELRFIYEIDYRIEVFGEEFSDQRIKKIIEKRDKKQDLALIFDCDIDEVGTKPNDLNRDLICYYGDIKNFGSTTIPEEIHIPKILIGSLVMPRIKSSKGLEKIELISGRLSLFDIDEIENIKKLKFVRDSIFFGKTHDIKMLTKLAKNNKVYIQGVGYDNNLLKEEGISRKR